MSRQSRIVIFGAGEGGRRARRFLARTVEVIAFCDNDPAKHGALLDGVPIFAAADLASLRYDRILIASMHDEAIFAQLLQMRVSITRIDVLDRAVLLGDDDPPRGCWMLIGATACLGLAAAITIWLF